MLKFVLIGILAILSIGDGRSKAPTTGRAATWNNYYGSGSLLAANVPEAATQNQQMRIFVGATENKAFFISNIVRLPEMIRTTDNCNYIGMMPASIDSEAEYELVREFLNTTELLPEGEKKIWLPATDHLLEGEFRWIHNKAHLQFAVWDSQTVNNRSLNCLTLNSNGYYQVAKCNLGEPHPLCFLQTMDFTSNLMPEIISLAENPSPISTTNVAPSPRLRPIGRTSTKYYYTDDNEILDFTSALDFCHEEGMRLASPETIEEEQFLMNFSMEPGARPIYPLGITTWMTQSCHSGNAYYGNFYNGNITDFDFTPSGVYLTKCANLWRGKISGFDCFTDGGVICEFDAEILP